MYPSKAKKGCRGTHRVWCLHYHNSDSWINKIFKNPQETRSPQYHQKNRRNVNTIQKELIKTIMNTFHFLIVFLGVSFIKYTKHNNKVDCFFFGLLQSICLEWIACDKQVNGSWVFLSEGSKKIRTIFGFCEHCH